ALIASYFLLRNSDNPEPLVAWQMNWRGETFYTKSRELPFVSLDNKAIQRWLERQRPSQQFFIIFEKGRLSSLLSVLGPLRRNSLQILSGNENNKFYLARATAMPSPSPLSQSPTGNKSTAGQSSP